VWVAEWVRVKDEYNTDTLTHPHRQKDVANITYMQM